MKCLLTLNVNKYFDTILMYNIKYKKINYDNTTIIESND